MARVKPIVNRDDVAAEHRALFDELAALRGRISGPSTIVLHSPGLARPWNEISEYLHRQSIVEPEHAELAVCATAREQDCAYIWNAHVALARKAGVPPATIDAVRDRRSVSGLYGPEASVILYVRQLIQNNRVASDVFDELLKAHGPQWLVELTYWVGRYQALAGILNGFEVTLPPGAEELPAVPRPQGPSSKGRAPLVTPRVEPITRRDQLVETHRPVVDAVIQDRGRIPGPFGLLLYSPALCRRHLDVGIYLRSRSKLERDATELAIIATAREKDCPYVWAAHEPTARKAGVSEPCVRAVRDHADLADVSEIERDIASFVRQLSRAHAVGQDLFDRLQRRHGVPWLVELTCLVGHYGITSSILNAFEVTPPPDGDHLPVIDQSPPTTHKVPSSADKKGP